MPITYVKAHMRFEDVTASEDSEFTSDVASSFSNMEMLKTEHENVSYGTFEQNQFVLDGSKGIYNNEDVPFWTSDMSKTNCRFDRPQILEINFTKNHSSAGITLVFAEEEATQIRLKWYLDGAKVSEKEYQPDSLNYYCKNQQEYDAITIEFIETKLPYRYVKLDRVIFGTNLEWLDDKIITGEVSESIDVTSSELAINTARIKILDADNEFDISNPDGAWNSVQRTQEVTITENKDGEDIPCGVFYIDRFSFSDNQATFEMVDAIGLMDSYNFVGRIYEKEKASAIISSIFACCGLDKYELEETLADIELSGYLGEMTCRQALQMVCFSIGAVADDARSDTVYIYKPDRHIKHTIERGRKFSGDSSVELDEYVSGVSITYKTYSLSDEQSKIFSGELAQGETRIEFRKPYKTDTVTATNGTIKEITNNYLVIESNGGACEVKGIAYEEAEKTYTKEVKELKAGERENVKQFSNITLVSEELLPEIAESLFAYYALQKTLSMRFLVDKEMVGEWATVMSIDGHASHTLIEQQTIDLAGGFISSAKCRGYNTIVTAYAYAGELYAPNSEVM